jgi:hypothetical protein
LNLSRLFVPWENGRMAAIKKKGLRLSKILFSSCCCSLVGHSSSSSNRANILNAVASWTPTVDCDDGNSYKRMEPFIVGRRDSSSREQDRAGKEEVSRKLLSYSFREKRERERERERERGVAWTSGCLSVGSC